MKAAPFRFSCSGRLIFIYTNLAGQKAGDGSVWGPYRPCHSGKDGRRILMEAKVLFLGIRICSSCLLVAKHSLFTRTSCSPRRPSGPSHRIPLRVRRARYEVNLEPLKRRCVWFAGQRTETLLNWCLSTTFRLLPLFTHRPTPELAASMVSSSCDCHVFR